MNTKQLRTYPPLYERMIAPVPDGLTNDLAQRLAQERAARRDAEQRLRDAEQRCMIAESELAALIQELRGLVERVTICTRAR